MTTTFHNHIAGQWQPALGGARFEDRNPADERDLIGLFPDSGAEDVQVAVAAVGQAWPAWAAASPEVRANVLFKAADLMSARAEAIAAELTREEGKTLGEALNESRRIAANFRLYAGEALRLGGETYASEAGQMVLSLRQPVGVVAVITPWNFPLSMAARKIAPALAAGNGVIFKPSEVTPLMGQRLVEVLLDAGLPAGLLALVHGRGASVGQAITASRGIDALTFTGSYQVGRQIAAALSTDTRCQLEMGGKNATIVLGDADLDKAAAIIRRGAFGLTGQACTGTSRVLVARPLYAAMVEKLAETARGIRVGRGTAEGVGMGPVATAQQYEKVLNYIDIARAEGARVVTGGASLRESDPALAHGYFISPAVIDGVTPQSRLMKEEIFGPVVAICPFDDFDEATTLADDTEYGLAVSLVTNDLQKVIAFAQRTQHGIVKVNSPTGGVSLNAPFGGFKHSSNQAAKEQGGANVMDFYTRIKAVYLGG
ncbi:aldehyde dehydrogenase family protein [Corticibacter populi]|uniref:4-(hydroxymethyl)benzenesulfonate dehydrogenase n=1 Tax=Corticibacter populi TaxID=1550736 RepID=A0A3M6QS79_9BURK|nr:aldehyde dehydrogenase family protein [Corticibacter populi]RMX05895.1 aldehyde dehydrogenase family protein [Corticibacter populi]RZS30786.1 aldehyde dehydrogenase (NAD+) [Corticibacter populi]